MEIKAYKKKNGTTAYKFKAYIGKKNGKSQYAEKSGFKTKADARAALHSIQEEIDNPTPKNAMTFKEFYDEWLLVYEKSVQNSTYYKTTRAFEKHVLPVLGNTSLSDFTPLELQNFRNDLSEKLKFARKLFGMVRKVFNHAVLLGYIQANPAAAVTSQGIKKKVKEKKDFYDTDELRDFLGLVEKTNDIKKIALFRVLAFTGIRKGELLALEWKDYRKSTLDINKAVSHSPVGYETLPPKANSNRLLSLDKKTCKILDALHQTYPKSTRIFESENGGMLSPSKPRKWLLEIIKDKNIEPIRIHAFRHTHASLLFESGMSLKQVQYRLGHADLKTTMNIYTHITKFAKDKIGQQFSDYIDF
ncbi:tyrosine-type recombinase/integrase [Lactococcus taiwanensis]|uniref:tyrosine-type recombinase/integrase n=1 Tax=Lactococcus taiwanensis TaxID=1151742 RepID=UPI0019651EAC|nr:site-specific integrase [Lactococcus taiwanensis]QRZ11416.1 tyrosine-type recombinase/integrase [Lactococcus taiwanensis]